MLYSRRSARGWLISPLLFWMATTSFAEKPDKAQWWSFQQATKPAIPRLAQSAPSGNPIDSFVLAKLAGTGLKASPRADARTLLRRVTFDLTGLPPTPEEAKLFLDDHRPDAFERLVDRLLASAAYGERWARHWLDVVHFGETHGYDKDKLRPNAWPYRDYVIHAFNADKPWPRFIEEQLAGDILFPESAEGIVATGFIAAGPWDFVGHVELPETKTDGLIARYNDRDDMVMTTMSTFQSLTVHCARCHDHKFDPITQRDYYNLQAVFAGVDRANRPYDADPALYARRRQLLERKKTLEQTLQKLEAEVNGTTSPELRHLNDRRAELRKELSADSVVKTKPKTLGYHSQIVSAADRQKWVQVDLGGVHRIDRITLIPAYEVFGGHPGPGFGFPARFQIATANDASFRESILVADESRADFPQPGNLPYTVPLTNVSARYVRVTATKLWLRTGDWIFALGEMAVISDGANIAAAATVTALDSIEAPPSWAARNLVDGISVENPKGDRADWLQHLFQQDTARTELRQVELERSQLLDRLVDASTQGRLAQTTGQLRKVTVELSTLPPARLVFAAAHEFAAEGSFKPAQPVRPVYVLARGDVKRPKDPAVPSPPAVFAKFAGTFDNLSETDEGARRAALAHWLTDHRNLLTRRSIVNRIWQYHFGRGIVDTPNDFGHMGSSPSHPELLDWLAFWFLENGESIKALHRLIVTSASYQQSSMGNPEGTRVDADNRLLWRMNRTRLEAEAIRDTMLAVAGQLDRQMGGPSVQQFFFKDDHSPVYDYARFDPDAPGAKRRAVYRHIVRSVPDPFMDCLDAADPSLLTPRRNTTLTALQALATLNNPFVLKQAEHFAERLAKSGKDPGQQLAYAFELALCRKPSSNELSELRKYAREHGMANTCRVIFNLNEFLFVD